METVLSPTPWLFSFFADLSQMGSQHNQHLLGFWVVSVTRQSHVQGVGIYAYRKGKVATAPLLVEAQLRSQYLTLYAEIVYRHDNFTNVGECPLN